MILPTVLANGLTRDCDFSPTPLDLIGPSPIQRTIIGNPCGFLFWGPNLGPQRGDNPCSSPLSHKTLFSLMTRSCGRGYYVSAFLGDGFDAL
jgi:hypothetical protein